VVCREKEFNSPLTSKQMNRKKTSTASSKKSKISVLFLHRIVVNKPVLWVFLELVDKIIGMNYTLLRNALIAILRGRAGPCMTYFVIKLSAVEMNSNSPGNIAPLSQYRSRLLCFNFTILPGSARIGAKQTSYSKISSFQLPQ